MSLHLPHLPLTKLLPTAGAIPPWRLGYLQLSRGVMTRIADLRAVVFGYDGVMICRVGI